VTISPSTEIDSQESSRAVINTRSGAFAGTADRGWLLAEVGGGGGTGWDGLDAGAPGLVAGSAGRGTVVEEFAVSAGFCSGGGCVAVAGDETFEGLAAGGVES